MMAEMLRLALLACSLAVLLFSCFKVAYALWWKPKALERHLRQQGIRGNPYRFFYGDLKDDMHARILASSKPMDLSHQIVPRAEPFIHQMVQKYEFKSLALTRYRRLHRFVPTAKNKRRVRIDREIKSMLMDMINKKLDSMAKGESTGVDLLGLLVQYSNDRDHGNYSITTDDVIEECKLFYFAGQETTSVLLTWTLILLSMYPTWQQRAREEVASVCGKDSPDFESTSRLKTVTMILHEVLRLYSPVNGILRRTIKTTKLGGFSFPAGIELFLPTLLIHHDREIWGEDAEEFKPERFSEGVSRAPRIPNAFFPFGWGPRICLGQSFAMIEAKMALACVLQHFCFELSPSYPHAPHSVVTLQPQSGAQLILHQL
ncbi:hypothetical protein B296_00017060 [Ensete ventricosum]|uniref:Cytochrome P450 n=1 Tax=Ensete ventricosum TaxID=4639 RepID=A0A427AAE8_ENSVE|nr:hypothetical protein B296_00017060 [Ensete ventricosum]